MGIISPLTAVLSALLPIGYGLARHQYPSQLAWIGIAVALIAVAAIGAGPAESAACARSGLMDAVAAGLLFGVFFIVLAQAQPDAGLSPVVGARLASIAAFALAGKVLRVSLRPAGNAMLGSFSLPACAIWPGTSCISLPRIWECWPSLSF